MEYVTKSCPHLCIIKKPRAHFEHGVFLFEHRALTLSTHSENLSTVP